MCTLVPLVSPAPFEMSTAINRAHHRFQACDFAFKVEVVGALIARLCSSPLSFELAGWH